MNSVIKTYDLSKSFGKIYAVDHVNLEVSKGQVYGFIGMNGAGKSTCIRMITGLLKPTTGSVEIMGKSCPKDLRSARELIGGYVDTPTFYSNMTAFQNLEVINRLFLKKNKSGILEILKKVSLDDVGDKPVKNFSMGMKQRLAIGRALVNNPEIIILDEPINGLDPAGIIEIRDLIKDLSQNHGITFLISSHILSELQKVATHYGIIKKGKLIEQISATDLEKKLKPFICVTGKDVNDIADFIENEMQLSDYELFDEGIKIYKGFERFDEISKKIISKVPQIKNISFETESLESYFLNKTGGDIHEPTF